MTTLDAAKAPAQAVVHSALGADLSLIAGLLILFGAYALVVALLVFTARCRTEPEAQPQAKRLRPQKPLASALDSALDSALAGVVSPPLRS